MCKSICNETLFELVKKCSLIRDFLDVSDKDIRPGGFYYGHMGNMGVARKFFNKGGN